MSVRQRWKCASYKARLADLTPERQAWATCWQTFLLRSRLDGSGLRPLPNGPCVWNGSESGFRAGRAAFAPANDVVLARPATTPGARRPDLIRLSREGSAVSIARSMQVSPEDFRNRGFARIEAGRRPGFGSMPSQRQRNPHPEPLVPPGPPA